MAVKAKKPVLNAAPNSSSSGRNSPRLADFGYRELITIGCDNIEAAAKTSAALSAGVEAVGEGLTAYARSSLQGGHDLIRGLLGVKTLDDVLKLQMDLAIRNLEGLVSGSAKLTALGVSLIGKVVAPWEDRAEAALAQFNRRDVKSGTI